VSIVYRDGDLPPATEILHWTDPSRDRIGVMLRTGGVCTRRYLDAPLLAVSGDDMDEWLAREKFLLAYEHWFRLAHARGGYS
jgi:hypothetical protein